MGKKKVVKKETVLDVLGDIFCEDVGKIILKFFDGKDPEKYALPGDPRRNDPLYRVCPNCDMIFHVFKRHRKEPRTELGIRHASLFLERKSHPREMIKCPRIILPPFIVEEHVIAPVCSWECKMRFEAKLLKDYNETQQMPIITYFEDRHLQEPLWFGKDSQKPDILLLDFTPQGLAVREDWYINTYTQNFDRTAIHAHQVQDLK